MILVGCSGRLGNALISRYWWLTILIWFGLVITLRLVAPRWDDITRDGDLAFLPNDMPSVVGERLRLGAFPENRSNSQIALIFSRDPEPLMQADLKASDRFASRFHNHLAIRLATEDKSLASSLEQLDEAIRLDPEHVEALHNRAIVRLRLGQEDVAKTDRDAAWKQDPELQSMPDAFVPQTETQLPLVDVWTRHNEVVGRDDLTDSASIPESNVQGAECSGNTVQGRIVNITELCGALGGPRLVKINEPFRRLTISESWDDLAKSRTTDVGSLPPNAAQIRATVGHTRDGITGVFLRGQAVAH